MMKTSRNKKRRQPQQNGRPVLVTFYVAQQRSKDGEGSSRFRATTSSSHGVAAAEHHHHHRHHHDGKFHSNRRADLLEYSRRLRGLAGQKATAAPPPPPLAPLDINTAAAARGGDEGQLAAVNRRLERAMSQQQIRRRCFGGDGGWSWKRVLLVVFPFHRNGRHDTARRPRWRKDDDGEKERNDKNQKRWPAALRVGQQTAVSKSRRGDNSGFIKTLMSVFQKRPVKGTVHR
ncbi:hypothetical protein BS78_08G073200 [Paspalum vaginatum]|nr:hypothetical protein BS78_08G073200 [Paspalum vaginatum]